MTSLQELMDGLQKTTDDYAESLPIDGDWNPSIFILKGDNVGIGFFDMPPNGDIRENFFQSVLPNEIRKMEPDAVALLVSTWYLEDVPADADPLPLPSESPNRLEAVLIQGVSKDEEITLMAKITRDGDHPELEWLDQFDEASMGGRLLSALRRGVWE